MPIPNELYTIICKHLSRQPMDAQEQARLHDWQKANPKAFEELSRAYWESQSDRPTFRRAEAQQKLNQRIDALEAESGRLPPRRFRLAPKIAASISFFLLFAGFAYYLYF